MEKLTVVKVGGAVVEDEEQLARLLNDFAAIEGNKVLVHGGGRRATKVAASLGIESKMVNGRRITDRDMLEVAIASIEAIYDWRGFQKEVFGGGQESSKDDD